MEYNQAAFWPANRPNGRLAAARPRRYIHRMAAKDFIGYQALVDKAFRGVVRDALLHAAKGGIMGPHHFYITFDTNAPGVQLSPVMREKHPVEITIVLQNQYWNLKVHDDRFEVGLSFNKAPETVVVPFAAIRQFHDPSQNFGFRLHGDAPSAPQPTAKAEPAEKPEALPAPPAPSAALEAPKSDQPTVVSLDKFRKK